MKKWFKKLEVRVMKILKTSTVHDYWHALRVCNLCVYIGKKEKAALDVLRAAALIHDIYAEKDYRNHISKSIKVARKILKSVGFPSDKIKDVVHCLRFHETYHWHKNKNSLSKEAKILQDADRLESLGAIGIARCFTFGGIHNRPIWIPGQKVDENWFYIKYSKSSVTQFYEKILRLKGGMNTKIGKKMAEGRHKFIKLYLKEFFKEWEGRV